MDVIGMFAAVHVSDLERSVDWYARLIGRAPDHRPMPTLVQWVGIAGAGLQLFGDRDKAGGGVMTIVTPSVDDARALLARSAIALGEIARGDFGAVAAVEDPDGNRIHIVEPPKPR